MRISEKDNYVIVQVLDKYLDKRAELHLYGSYIDNQADGGSIDLLLIVANDDKKDELTQQQASIKDEIESQIEAGEITLLIASEQKAQRDEHIRDILPGSVFLYRW